VGTPALRVIRAGTGRVLYTPIDLTSGLLETPAWGIAGYDTEYAERITADVVRSATSGGK
jgi:hypothetical protein